MTCLFPEFTPAMSLAAPRMVASIDVCQRARPGREHYPGRSGTFRWPQERPFETLQRPTSVQTRAVVLQPNLKLSTWKRHREISIEICVKGPSESAQLYLCEHFHPLLCSATIILQQKCRHPCLQAHPFFFFWSHDKRIQKDSHTRARVLHPMRSSLEFTQSSKNTHAEGSPPSILQKSSHTTKASEQ